MTAAIDITATQQEMLLAILRRYIPGVLVWAYGSRVKFTARPYSDLDLVAFASPAQRPAIADLKDELAESDLPFLVNLHIWDDVPQHFHDIIRKDYVVLQEASSCDPAAANAENLSSVALAKDEAIKANLPARRSAQREGGRGLGYGG
jgi:predicted nucleotidyltransferase